MSYDVFISHSTKDKEEADTICQALEAAKISCWIAPRNIMPGEDWREAIVQAISNSQVLILVHSANSNQSKDVAKEISLAINQGISVVPIKIEDVAPTGPIKYNLTDLEWIDAESNLDQKSIGILIETVKPLLKEDSSPGYGNNPLPESHAFESKGKAIKHLNKKGKTIYLAAGIITTLLLGFFLIYLLFLASPDHKIIDISAGRDFSLILLDNGEVYSFGAGWNGQLGHGNHDNVSLPQKIDNIYSASAISAGRKHSLILLSDGSLYSFGSGENGILGQGDGKDRLTPEKVEDIYLATKIAAGWHHSIVIAEIEEEKKTAYTFGLNDKGQLGIADSESRLEPETIFATWLNGSFD